MNLAPIILFVYNRPWHSQQTLEALAQNDLANESVLYIYADGAKEGASEETLLEIEKTRQVIRNQKWCKEVHIIERAKNWGLADSIVDGVTQTVNRYGKVIVLEDDIVTSKGFLKYMNNALDFYEKKEQVMHISGYMFPVKGKLPPNFFYNTATCWGWGTWQRAWQHFNYDAQALCEKIEAQNQIDTFNIENTYNFYGHLKANAEKTMKTWAVRWYASFFLKEGMSLHPYPSLTNNIGHDGTGENCHHLDVFNWKQLADSIPIEEIPIEASEKARKLMQKFNDPPTPLKERVKNLIRPLVPKALLMQLKKLR